MNTWQAMVPRTQAEDLIFRELVNASRECQDATLDLFALQAPEPVARIKTRLEHARRGREIFLEAIG